MARAIIIRDSTKGLPMKLPSGGCFFGEVVKAKGNLYLYLRTKLLLVSIFGFYVNSRGLWVKLRMAVGRGIPTLLWGKIPIPNGGWGPGRGQKLIPKWGRGRGKFSPCPRPRPHFPAQGKSPVPIPRIPVPNGGKIPVPIPAYKFKLLKSPFFIKTKI